MSKTIYSFENAQFAAMEYHTAKSRISLIDSLIKDARISSLQEIGIIFVVSILYSHFARVAVLGTILGLLYFGLFIAALIYNNNHFYSKVSGGAAFATIANIAHWGWLLVPVFPADVIVGLCILVYGFFAMIALPALYLRLVRNTEKKRLEEAEAFVKLYEHADEVFEMLYKDDEEYEYNHGVLEEKIKPKFCTHCGAQLNGNMKFCTKCGTQLG
ncbi:zinc ribbon domain-containing protein [Butyrivibrio sp. VCB2006]|uniref:zinc ribbon domain-containing protein n=1 Tax=Butyrivibrio sp. VCB2006 TaxID=1280679 RepID=UPI0004287D4A|nr:zinc ribbon domain-containing protein [Butyrivibrio sp. VCB2006]